MFDIPNDTLSDVEYGTVQEFLCNTVPIKIRRRNHQVRNGKVQNGKTSIWGKITSPRENHKSEQNLFKQYQYNTVQNRLQQYRL